MKGSLELIRPLLGARGADPAGKIVIGTVKGDLHDSGKNLVSSMLEGGGFEVVDLGADVSPEEFVRTVRERKPDLVCLSDASFTVASCLCFELPSRGEIE